MRKRAMTDTDTAIAMTGEKKLQQMLDRGWAITITRQKSIGTWDVSGAISSWELRKEQNVYHYGGFAETLLAALERIEPHLAEMAIKDYAEMLSDDRTTAAGRKRILQSMAEMQKIIEDSTNDN